MNIVYIVIKCMMTLPSAQIMAVTKHSPHSYTALSLLAMLNDTKKQEFVCFLFPIYRFGTLSFRYNYLAHRFFCFWPFLRYSLLSLLARLLAVISAPRAWPCLPSCLWPLTTSCEVAARWLENVEGDGWCRSLCLDDKVHGDEHSDGSEPAVVDPSLKSYWLCSSLRTTSCSSVPVPLPLLHLFLLILWMRTG